MGRALPAGGKEAVGGGPVRGIVSTYRLQVESVGGLDQVADRVSYFHRLGVSTLYLSPIFRAHSDSAHGYDVVDPGEIDPGLGGTEAYRHLCDACRSHGMNLVLDIVPNHMAASHENPWWWSVLRKGRDSPYADFFDVDWDDPPGPARNKIVLPILGERYHRAVGSGDLTIGRGPKGPEVRYGDRRVPLAPESGAELGDTDLERLNRAGEDPDARRALDELLVRQNYWLVHWRTAPEEINYRRFFNISDLVALRMEREAVFRAWHRFLGELIADPVVAGVRVDHVDGLRDPGTYLHRLRTLARDAGRDDDRFAILVEKILAPGERLPERWETEGTSGYDFLAASDGLLVDGEGLASLRDRYGTFTGRTEGFQEEARRGKRAVIRGHFRRDLDRLVEDAMPGVRRHPRGRDLAPSEVKAALLEITAQLRVYRTYAGERSDEAGRRATARGGRDGMPSGETDDVRAPLHAAAGRGRRRRRDLPADAFRVLEALLSPNRSPQGDEDEEGAALVRRWQQFTGAVMAKGVEDTAFYVHHPLASLNEVGSEPGAELPTMSEFHAFNQVRQAEVPRALNASSTHDTKRSEDVRARIHVLSELPGEWGRAVRRWSERNRERKRNVRGRPVPTPNEEWLLYQTLVGVWPLAADEDRDLSRRLEDFLRKAAREAKEHTSWLRPREDHEEALLDFLHQLLEDERFLDDFSEFQEKTAFYGALNSLSQCLLRVASPGAPDLYQGTELWTLSLVDPDNRRPVDFERRRSLLDGLREIGTDAESETEGRTIAGETLGKLRSGWKDGRIKLFLLHRALTFRREHPGIFREGTYQALEPAGPRGQHVVAFLRRHGDRWVLTLVPRLPTGLVPAGDFPLGVDTWKVTSLELPKEAPSRWRNVITDEEVVLGEDVARLEVGRVLDRFPVALLYGR